MVSSPFVGEGFTLMENRTRIQLDKDISSGKVTGNWKPRRLGYHH